MGSSLRLTRALSLSAAEVSYGREVTDEDVAHFVKEGFLIKKNFYSLEEIELIHKVKVSARQRSDLQVCSRCCRSLSMRGLPLTGGACWALPGGGL